MTSSRRLNDPSVNMMNTRKILMIIGALLLGAVGITYLMLLQADRRSMAEVTAAMDKSAPHPVVDSRSSDHVTEGSIGQPEPSGASTKSTAIAQQPEVPAPAPAPSPAPSPAPAVAPAPMTAAPASSPAAAQVTGQPKPETRPKQAPSMSVASVNVQDSGAPKVVPAHSAQRGRDSLDRRAATTRGATPGATPETDELVRESAKLDPSLPPPDMSAARAAMDQRSSKPGTGSNPVAAAMTNQLVKESAKLDPSLPPPK